MLGRKPLLLSWPGGNLAAPSRPPSCGLLGNTAHLPSPHTRTSLSPHSGGRPEDSIPAGTRSGVHFSEGEEAGRGITQDNKSRLIAVIMPIPGESIGASCCGILRVASRQKSNLHQMLCVARDQPEPSGCFTLPCAWLRSCFLRHSQQKEQAPCSRSSGHRLSPASAFPQHR